MGIMKMGGKLWSNLFHKPATLGYPVVPREYPDASRGHLEFDPSDCILCNICGKKCPADAIRADKAARTLSIQRMQCIQCSYCADSCPKHCLSMTPGYTEPDPAKVTDTYTVPEKEKPAPKEGAEASQ
ncbi:MAG: 4Fe-4S binding protein [Thermoplasmata archaeon]|nr:4Fe-4S binding protein [Thermoplasmata archaeon]